MPTPRRSNIRSWLLLLLALVPTGAVLYVGVWVWSTRGDELTSRQNSVLPIEMTYELFNVATAVQRLNLTLTAAAMPDAPAELIDVAERDLDRTHALLETSPTILEQQIAVRAGLGLDNESDPTLQLIADSFRLASGVVTQQVPGEPPTLEMRFLATMSRENASGLVLPFASSGSEGIAYLYGTIAASIDYHATFSNDGTAVVYRLIGGTADFPLADLAGAPLRAGLWSKLIDSRQFVVAGVDDIEWRSTTPDPERPLFLLREEPLATIVAADATPTTIEERANTLLAIFAIDDDIRADIDVAYSTIQEITAAQIIEIERERRLTAIASIVVSIVGLALLGMTIAEVRQRRSVERAHDAAIMLLADKAQRDPTTGAWNRRRLEATLDDLLESTRESTAAVVLGYIDLDSFKAINDVWGHATGDQVLRIVTERLANLSHQNHAFELIRFGGDEFVLYSVVEAPDLTWLESFGAAILSTLDDPMTVKGREHGVSASVGVTMSDQDSTLDSLLLEADSSLILAKRHARGTAIVYNRKISRTGELVHALPKALTDGEIHCHLQPVYDMRSGTVAYAEALARWFRPNGESVSPGVFVPLVESFGLADQLTSTMLRSIAAVLRDPATPTTARIWVNLSPRELEVANFAARFSDRVHALCIDPTRIGLEITETAAVRDHRALAVELTALRATGVAVAIDDFGSGYSPLGFLRDLPVDVVKLDRSLIAGIDRDVGNQHIVKGIVGMLREFGMSITAEGVERVEEEAWLVEHGVYSIQGFLRGRPVGPDVFDWTSNVSMQPNEQASLNPSMVSTAP